MVSHLAEETYKRMGNIVHKTTETLGDIVVCTNIYISSSKKEVSITQDMYDGDHLVHKNNVILMVEDLRQILTKV